MNIRLCTAADRSEVNRLVHQSREIHMAAEPDHFLAEEETFSEDLFAQLLADDHIVLLCADNGTSLAGYCRLDLQDRCGLSEMKNAHVYDIVVDGACRGQGIGHLLMAEAEARAKAWGAKQLNLNCWAFNDGARRLYESLGLRPQRTFMVKEL